MNRAPTGFARTLARTRHLALALLLLPALLAPALAQTSSPFSLRNLFAPAPPQQAPGLPGLPGIGPRPQTGPEDGTIPRPSALIPNPGAPAPGIVVPAPLPNVPPPPGGFPAATPPPIAAPTQRAPSQPGRTAVTVIARFTADGAAINAGLYWRIFAEKADATGKFPVIAESRDASAVFNLLPGAYVVHASYGLAGGAKRIVVSPEPSRETLVLPAGGLRLGGIVEKTPIAAGRVSFDIFQGSQFDQKERLPVARDLAVGEVLLLPEGQYHVVSNYGDANAVVRADLRVVPGKLTDAVLHHRAAQVTLKLIGEAGGEALANTAWSVLTPAGDVIKESIGAFPVVVLAEGDYVAIARHEGKTYNKEFRVDPGFDREIEVLAKDAAAK